MTRHQWGIMIMFWVGTLYGFLWGYFWGRQKGRAQVARAVLIMLDEKENESV